MNNHPEFERQLALEEAMATEGIDRYRSTVSKAREKGREGTTEVGKTILGTAFEDTLKKVEEFISEVESKGNGSKYHSYRILSKIDLDLCVFISLRVLVDGISTRETLTTVAFRIANLIEDELHYRAFKEQKFYSFSKTVEKAKKSPSDHVKRRMLRETARKKKVKFEGFSQNEKLNLGVKLVECVCEGTGLIEIRQESGRAPKRVEAGPNLLEKIEQMHKAREWLAPVYLPTIIPPKPWTSSRSGGYWSGRARRLTLVKTKHRDFLDQLDQTPMPVVYECINAVQDTAWRINREVFNVMSTMWDLGIGHGIIPDPDPAEMPAKPFWLTPEMTVEDMTEEQKEEFLGWKGRMAQTYAHNAQQTCKRLTFQRIFSTAERFLDEPTIYFPHQLDFRGRIYPVPLFLHPQGSEECRALLTFAESKQLGSQEAVRWLAAHGAGCWGVDKVSFEDRMAWIRNHENDIVASAEDPLGNLFWTTAEKPWSALAFCFEWAGYLRDGLAHRSSLPVQMDGSCNGLQHFSAMLRDPIGGEAVNLVSGEAPRDIYQTVADEVSKLVQTDILSTNEKDAGFAKGWVGNVTRKVTKRPTMTLSYGAKQFGFTDQVFTDTVSPWRMKDSANFPFEGNGYTAAMYMAHKIWDATQSVVVGARGAMDALQKWTSELSKAERPVYWTTPSGFIMRQEYNLPETRKVDLTFGTERIVLNVNREDKKGKLDKRKQSAGVSPNFVHSLDAAHLALTVSAAIHSGIHSFSMIHDSYGTHAADAPMLARILREEFVRMYEEHDVLADFRERIQQEIGEELMEVPERGALDLRQVMQSPYFFA
jgi:DNA-directed RNA polymerase, mitochondrial